MTTYFVACILMAYLIYLAYEIYKEIKKPEKKEIAEMFIQNMTRRQRRNDD